MVAQQLNEAERDAENMNKTFKIQEKLSGDFEVSLNLINTAVLTQSNLLDSRWTLTSSGERRCFAVLQAQRHYQATGYIIGQLIIFCLTLQHQGDRYFYLFNDVLLHVKLSKKIQKKNSIGGAVTPQELTATAAPKLQFKEQFTLGKEVALSDMDGQQFALVDGADWTKRLMVLEAKYVSWMTCHVQALTHLP